MDRFIDYNMTKSSNTAMHLKSNMDRFIAIYHRGQRYV